MINDVVILVDGSLDEVLTDADKDRNLLVLDYNSEANYSELKMVEGEEAYIYEGIVSVKSDPERVKKIFAQAERELKKQTYTDPEHEFIVSVLNGYLEEHGITLTEEQKQQAYNGIQSWLSNDLGEVIVESVSNVIS